MKICMTVRILGIHTISSDNKSQILIVVLKLTCGIYTAWLEMWISAHKNFVGKNFAGWACQKITPSCANIVASYTLQLSRIFHGVKFL